MKILGDNVTILEGYKIVFIYKLECNQTGEVYYGSSKNITNRIKEHKSDVNNCASKSIIERNDYTFNIASIHQVPYDYDCQLIEDEYIKKDPKSINIRTYLNTKVKTVKSKYDMIKITETKINNFINTKLITINEYFKLKENIEENTNEIEIMLYKKFDFFVSLFNINLKEIQDNFKNIVYSSKQREICENELFRQMIHYEDVNNYDFIKKYLINKKIDNVIQIRDLFKNKEVHLRNYNISITEISTKIEKNTYANYLILRLIDIFDIPNRYYYTVGEFKTILNTHNLFFDKHFCMYNNYIWNNSKRKKHIEYYESMDTKEPKLLIIFYHIINNLLNKINLQIKYKTDKRNDKSIMYLLSSNTPIIKYTKPKKTIKSDSLSKLKYENQDKIKEIMMNTPLLTEKEYILLLKNQNRKDKKKERYFSKTNKIKRTKYELNLYYNNNIPYDELFKYENCIYLEMLKSGSSKYKYIKTKIIQTQPLNCIRINYYYPPPKGFSFKHNNRLYKLNETINDVRSYKPYNIKLNVKLLNLSKRLIHKLNIIDLISNYITKEEKSLLLLNHIEIKDILLILLSRHNKKDLNKEITEKSHLLFIPMN